MARQSKFPMLLMKTVRIFCPVSVCMENQTSYFPSLKLFHWCFIYPLNFTGFRPTGPHIPSDGKAPVVAPVVVDKVNAVYEPNYNRYNPTDYRNQYNNQFGQYNRPYNTRYPYDSRNPYNSGRYNPYNNYNNQYYNNFNPFSTAVPSTIQPKSESS